MSSGITEALCSDYVQYPAPAPDVGICPVWVPDFQVNIDSIGRPIESIQFKQVGKKKEREKERTFS